MPSTDVIFAGSIPQLYDEYLGPLLFEPFASDLAERAVRLAPRDILETAAGTGIVTAALASCLPDSRIVATDLNQAMLDVAARRLVDRVELRQADALALPFADHSFDLVLCQFGVMFFPDRIAAYWEARRVLRDDGRFLFVVWDRLESNPASLAASSAVASLFPDDPPSFLRRIPFGYHDPVRIESELHEAGFASVAIETLARTGRMASARAAATGLCQGSPLRSEIEQRDPKRLEEATLAAAEAIGALPESRATSLSALLVDAGA